MDFINIRQAQSKDYPAIIELQNANTPDQLTEEERKQGFVVSAMTEETINTINENLGILVAVENEKLVGFVCLDSTDVAKHPVVKSMLESFPKQEYHEKPLTEYKIFTYGPVLINPKWRKKGILKKLFAAVKEYTGNKYDLGAAFINEKNPHSLTVHVQGLGMTALKPFQSDGQSYHLVVFEV